jgi:hypothetical protein
MIEEIKKFNINLDFNNLDFFNFFALVIMWTCIWVLVENTVEYFGDIFGINYNIIYVFILLLFSFNYGYLYKYY